MVGVLSGSGFGLIPACAGKTTRARRSTPATMAHPRVCGENAQVYNDILPGGGSSPRVRGKLSTGSEVDIKGRLIPACAGKTGSDGALCGAGRAHPRVCGENVP